MPVIPDPANFPSTSQKGDNSSSQGHDNKKASAMDHISKGPQIPDNIPPKASREEIEARMKELNQK